MGVDCVDRERLRGWMTRRTGWMIRRFAATAEVTSSSSDSLPSPRVHASPATSRQVSMQANDLMDPPPPNPFCATCLGLGG
jgi:hypothetical protein